MTFELTSKLHFTVLYMALLRFGVQLDVIGLSTGELVRTFTDNFESEKVKGIKYVRQSSDWGLKESKEFVEDVFAKVERAEYRDDIARIRNALERCTVRSTKGYEFRNDLIDGLYQEEAARCARVSISHGT